MINEKVKEIFVNLYEVENYIEKMDETKDTKEYDLNMYNAQLGYRAGLTKAIETLGLYEDYIQYKLCRKLNLATAKKDSQKKAV